MGGRLRQGAGAGTIGRTGDGPALSRWAAYQGVAHVTATSLRAVAMMLFVCGLMRFGHWFAGSSRSNVSNVQMDLLCAR